MEPPTCLADRTSLTRPLQPLNLLWSWHQLTSLPLPVIDSKYTFPPEPSHGPPFASPRPYHRRRLQDGNGRMETQREINHSHFFLQFVALAFSITPKTITSGSTTAPPAPGPIRLDYTA
ncbi:hypothetical protein GE21DRAFT_1129134 [Neurospora crassa]|nr:hypothetical protein GE21DRAFT_1129134 [Neurospora crassa]